MKRKKRGGKKKPAKKDVVNGKSLFDQLPDEIILHIVSAASGSRGEADFLYNLVRFLYSSVDEPILNCLRLTRFR